MLSVVMLGAIMLNVMVPYENRDDNQYLGGFKNQIGKHFFATGPQGIPMLEGTAWIGQILEFVVSIGAMLTSFSQPA